MSNNDNPVLNTLAFKIEKIYDQASENIISPAMARTLVKKAIIDYSKAIDLGNKNQNYFDSRITNMAHLNDLNKFCL